MDAQDLHPAEVKLKGYRTVWESDLTEGDKLFLMSLIGTYLPTEAIPEPGGEAMTAIRDIEMTWLERVRMEMKEELEEEVKQELEEEIKEQVEEAKKETKLEMARGLIGILDEPLISQLTGLSLEEVLALKQETDREGRSNGGASAI